MYSQVEVCNYTHNNNLCHCIIRGKDVEDKEMKSLCRGTYNFKKKLYVIKHINILGRTESGFKGIIRALEKHNWESNIVGIDKAKSIVRDLVEKYKSTI